MFGSMFGFAFGAQNFPGLPPTQDLIVVVYCELNELYTGCMKKISFKKTVLNNDGRTTREETFKRVLDIKPGYQEGNTIVFKEQGHESSGKKTSDLIFMIKEIEHAEFERKGNELIYTAKISLMQALCPDSIKIITLDGRTLMISLDEIVHPKSLKKISGEGMPIYDEENTGKKGDLLIKFDIEFPEALEQGDKMEIIGILKQAMS